MNAKQITENDRTAAKALVLAISAIAACLIIPIAVPTILASIAIVLAILSKGLDRKFSLMAKRAFITALTAIVINITVIAGAVYTVNRMITDVQVRNTVSAMLYDHYGITFEDFARSLDESFGTNIMEQMGETSNDQT